MKHSTLASLLLVLLAISTVDAQDQSPRQRAKQFFATLIHGETDKAYDQLFVGSMAETNSTKLDALKRQTAENLPPYGKPIPLNRTLQFIAFRTFPRYRARRAFA